MTEKEIKKPIQKFRIGAISVSIWKNEAQNKAGETFPVFSTNIQRYYKDKDGNDKNTDSLNLNDIPKAIVVLQKAYEYIATGGDKE